MDNPVLYIENLSLLLRLNLFAARLERVPIPKAVPRCRSGQSLYRAAVFLGWFFRAGEPFGATDALPLTLMENRLQTSPSLTECEGTTEEETKESVGL